MMSKHGKILARRHPSKPPVSEATLGLVNADSRRIFGSGLAPSAIADADNAMNTHRENHPFVESTIGAIQAGA